MLAHPEILNAIGQIHLAELETMPLPDLENIIQQVEAVKTSVRHYDVVLQSALNRRFGERAQQLRQAAGKQTGTVRLEDDGYRVIADLPKRVEYDQGQLHAAVAVLREWHENPEDYVTLEIKVAEARYNAWPPAIRQLFEPARTVKTGKPSFKLEQLATSGLPAAANASTFSGGPQ